MDERAVDRINGLYGFARGAFVAVILHLRRKGATDQEIADMVRWVDLSLSGLSEGAQHHARETLATVHLGVSSPAFPAIPQQPD